MAAKPRPIVLTLVAGLFVWLFAEALLGGGMFAFRDAAHFYYPLFRFAGDQWAAGRVPLWNPCENLGQPLAADASSSVFYPGKLIFALPLDYAWAYKIYILGHLLLAAAAAYRLARHFAASVAAAGLCAMSYACCGNVLFDYTNVVFLVGAAWLPVAVLATDRMLRERSLGWAAALGAVLALMTLGGDPQMAYLVGVLAAAYAALLWWHAGPLSFWERIRARARVRGTGRARDAGTRPHPGPLPAGEGKQIAHPGPLAGPVSEGEGGIIGRLQRSRLSLLVLSAVVGLVLSAIQVLISIEFTYYSGRVGSSFADRLRGRLPADTHQEHVYHFSVGPWRLAEYVWPNLSGRQFPVNRRWVQALPFDRTWTPSLYMGLLPLLLALSAMRFRRAEPLEKWLSWTAVLAVAASFGWYGPGWLAHEIRTACGGDPQAWPVGAPFGGVYWLMVLLLPGFEYFRYPAKLLVIAALALSVLSARGWDSTFAGRSDRLRRWLLWVGGLSVGAALVALAIRPFWSDWLAGAEPDALFGPLDTPGAFCDLLAALVQTAVLCGLSWWLLTKRGQNYLSPAQVTPDVRAHPAKNSSDPFLLLLVALDLAVANRWMVVCAPADLWEETPALAAAIEQAEQRSSPAPRRVYRHPQWDDHGIWLPPLWKTSSSPDRLAGAVQWERDTLWPKYNLPEGIAIAEVQGTMMLHIYEVYLAAAEKKKQPPWDAVGAEYVILPGDQVLPGAERVDVDVADVSLWRNPRPRGRAWILHNVDENAAGPGRRLRESAIPGESCNLVYYDPLRVEIDATLIQPGLVVLREQFYPGWHLEVATAGEPAEPVPILQTNRVMRGAWLAAGEHHLVYRYRPVRFFWGAAASGLGWIGLTIWGAAWWFRGRRAGGR